MIRSMISGTERALSKMIVWLLGFMLLSLFLLAGLLFAGFALFLFLQDWFTPVSSALITASVSLLGMVISVLVIKASLARMAHAPASSGKPMPHSHQTADFLREKPLTSLSLCAAAGFLYESDPRLKEQVHNLLLNVLEKTVSDPAEQKNSEQ